MMLLTKIVYRALRNQCLMSLRFKLTNILIQTLPFRKGQSMFLSEIVSSESVPDSLFTLLRYVPDYFLYHLQSGVIFTLWSVPD